MWHITLIFVTPLTTLDLGNDKNIIKTIGLKQFKAVTACQIKTLLAELNKCRTSPVHETLFAIVILNRLKRFPKWTDWIDWNISSFSLPDIWYRCWVTWVQIKREELDLEKSREISLLPLGVTEKCWNAQSKLRQTVTLALLSQPWVQCTSAWECQMKSMKQNLDH